MVSTHMRGIVVTHLFAKVFLGSEYRHRILISSTLLHLVKPPLRYWRKIQTLRQWDFFSSMSSINKIYKILAPLEMNVIDYVGKARSSNLIRNNGSYFVVKEQDIRNQLSQLSNLLDNGGRTVQLADFQFMGQQNRLANIIWAVTELTNQTAREINLYK